MDIYFIYSSICSKCLILFPSNRAWGLLSGYVKMIFPSDASRLVHSLWELDCSRLCLRAKLKFTGHFADCRFTDENND